MQISLRSCRHALPAVLIVAFVPGISVADPIPTDAKCYTDAKLHADTLLLRKSEIDHYRKTATVSPEMLQKGVDFLDACYRGQSSLGVANLEPITSLGKEAGGDKSADPLVRLNYAVNLGQSKQLVEAYTIGSPAAKEVCKAGFPANTRMGVCRAMLDICNRTYWFTEAEKWLVDYDRYAVEFVQTADSPVAHRILSKWIYEVYGYLPVGRQAELLKACQKLETKNTWAIEQMEGSYEYNVAWEHRGTGFANTVSEEKFKLFMEHLKVASQRFTSVWQKKPEFPYAATSMIGVAMAGGDDATPREWFARALAAQMDFRPAYTMLLFALLPRWGGSHEDMLALGEECAATKRFDTDVPLIYLDAVLAIQGDGDEGKDVLKREGVYETIRNVYEACASDPSRADEKGVYFSSSYLRSKLANIAMNAGRNDDAKRILNELGPKLIPAALARDAAEARLAIDQMYAMDSEQAAVFKSVYPRLESTNRHNPDERDQIKLVLESGMDGTTDARGKRWFQYWLRILQDEQDFDDGKWVDLSFDRTRMSWRIPAGELDNWAPAGDRAVIVNSSHNRADVMLLEAPRFSGPIEVEVTCDFLRESPRWASKYQIVGLLADYTLQPNEFFYAYIEKHPPAFSTAHSKLYGREFRYKDDKKPKRLMLRAWDKLYSFSVDDGLLLIGEDDQLTTNGTIGLSAAFCWSNAVKFRDMRVRKLTLPRPSPTDSRDTMLAWYRDLIHRDAVAPDHQAFMDAVGFLEAKKPKQAIDSVKKAMSLGVSGPHANWVLGQCYEADGQYAKARDEFLKSLDAKKDYADALASLEASCPDEAIRNAKNAKSHATRACELTEYKRSSAIEALAVACAEEGDFDAAVRWSKKSLEIADKSEQPTIKEHLGLFEKKKVFRSSPQKVAGSPAK